MVLDLQEESPGTGFKRAFRTIVVEQFEHVAGILRSLNARLNAVERVLLEHYYEDLHKHTVEVHEEEKKP